MNAELARHAKGVSLIWPAQGNVVEGFQAGETRGIEIGGKPGDPIRAAADGKVMYAGTGLNEYGSLIIVQHNKDFLTAYAHNRKLLVKTGDIVRRVSRSRRWAARTTRACRCCSNCAATASRSIRCRSCRISADKARVGLTR
ncbi:hypothetical protein PPGU19_039910 [Paraburkholderia sp. PGU19]|nr:hypothetical protein PPGU19_039910 [Paraburkholderia sp. PGU19]